MHMPPPVHGAAMVGQYIHDSRLINETFECHYINLTTAKNLEDVGKGGFKKFLKLYHKLQEIKNNIKQINPHFIYITPCSAGGPFYKDFVIVELVKKWSKNKNIVIHFHNKGVKTRQTKWFDNKLYKHFFKGLKVILLGEGLYEDIKKYVNRKDVLICPNGISDIIAHKSTKDSIPHILWLTNIMKTKGIIEYLESLKIMKDKGLVFRADFVGGTTSEINEEDFMAYITHYGLNDVVSYHGCKYGDEKIHFFNTADLFVLPSYTEAFPLTILEAMQYSLPVVATNVGGISTQISHGINGLLIGGISPIMENTFRPSPQELSDAIETLITNPELRKKMGEEGRKKFEKDFTLECFEQRFVEIIRGLTE